MYSAGCHPGDLIADFAVSTALCLRDTFRASAPAGQRHQHLSAPPRHFQVPSPPGPRSCRRAALQLGLQPPAALQLSQLQLRPTAPASILPRSPPPVSSHRGPQLPNLQQIAFAMEVPYEQWLTRLLDVRFKLAEPAFPGALEYSPSLDVDMLRSFVQARRTEAAWRLSKASREPLTGSVRGKSRDG